MENKRDLLEAYREICLKSGAVTQVGPDFYKFFADLSDADTEELVTALAHANADTINGMIFKKPRTISGQDIIDFIEMMLNLLFHGFIAIRPDGDSIGCFAPEGPPPTDEEELAMDRRIRSAFPLIPNAVLRATRDGNRKMQPNNPTDFGSRR